MVSLILGNGTEIVLEPTAALAIRYNSGDHSALKMGADMTVPANRIASLAMEGTVRVQDRGFWRVVHTVKVT